MFKNNQPRYLLIDPDISPMIALTDNERIDMEAARILAKYKPAFEKLAKG